MTLLRIGTRDSAAWWQIEHGARARPAHQPAIDVRVADATSALWASGVAS